MLETLLVAERTAEANGEGEALELGDAVGKQFLLTLGITRVLEQESLDVSVWGSEEGCEWGGKPLAAFPQKFYTGTHQILLDLSDRPTVKFLRCRWETNRWGRGHPTPRFTFSVAIRELADQLAA